MESQKEKLLSEIDKYKASIKKIKSVIPLVTVVIIASITFFINSTRVSIAIVGIISIFAYAGSFVWAYFKCLRKIKNLEEQTEEL